MERYAKAVRQWCGDVSLGDAAGIGFFLLAGVFAGASGLSMYRGDGYAFQLVTLAGICWLIGDRYGEDA